MHGVEAGDDHAGRNHRDQRGDVEQYVHPHASFSGHALPRRIVIVDALPRGKGGK